MLRFIKLLHTVVWLIMAGASLYVLYASLRGYDGLWLWLCIILLCIESLILALNGWVCPLTPLAGKYTHDRSSNFDIYLPLFVARHNKLIFGGIFIIGLVIVLYGRIIHLVYQWLTYCSNFVNFALKLFQNTIKGGIIPLCAKGIEEVNDSSLVYGRSCRVYPATPYDPNWLQSSVNVSNMLLRQYLFPDTYDEIVD